MNPSGKSTWAREFCKDNANYVRINRDDLRHHLFGKYSGLNFRQEDEVRRLQTALIVEYFRQGVSVVIDDTNLVPKTIARLEQLAKQNRADVEFRSFLDVPITECSRRDAQRERSVGERVIRSMWNQYAAKHISYSEDPSLPHCIIVDVDGTLALKSPNRSIYEYAKVYEDSLNIPVYKAVTSFAGTDCAIIIMSGRDDDCKDVTVEWLMSKNVPFKEIYMRSTGDKRSDDIVKRELFENNLRGRFFVEAVFDDRQKVVDMWRSLGLTTFQVADGSF